MRIFLFFFLFMFMGTVPAWGWQPHLSADLTAPERLFVVDKEEQSLVVFSNKSPLRKEYDWKVTTGEVQGDKKKEGDLKTPEGIYFLENKIIDNLDYELYGEMALTLNYPNPVDKIQDRTGFGIWLHGRGREVVPFDTEGCVAMDMEYMLKLEEKVDLQRTPVIIARSATWDQQEQDNETTREINRLSREWARAWAAGSGEYFQFYHPDKFAQSSGKPFEEFKDHKEGLFQAYSWIDVYIEEPRVLAGPGYWVSYFGQVFNASDFYSQGIKRLYWKKDEQGTPRIVGEEWRDYSNPDLKSDYQEKRKQDLREVVREWRKAWLDADLEDYADFYYQGAVQNDRVGRQAIKEQKRDLWGSGHKPEKIEISEMEIEVGSAGFQASFVQKYASVKGYQDLGVKKLEFIPDKGDGWVIKRETWSELE